MTLMQVQVARPSAWKSKSFTDLNASVAVGSPIFVAVISFADKDTRRARKHFFASFDVATVAKRVQL